MRLIRFFALSLLTAGLTAGMVTSAGSPASADPLDTVGAVVTSVAGPGVCC
jgi:hypothetical protein